MSGQEAHQSMLEREQRLEEALSKAELYLSEDDMQVIRFECGKSKPRNSHVNPLLRDVINDFGAIFGANQPFNK
jgi:hypothetical protein